MAPSKDPSPERQPSDSSADLAQAYRDLARGEQAATALEANLNNLEGKLDALLAAMDAMDEGQKDSKVSINAGEGKAPENTKNTDGTEGKGKSGPTSSS